MNRRLALAIGAALGLAATVAGAQTKWDLPAGYPAGRLEITVHPGASLFKVPEIKRAVQTGQAQIGELLMVVLENEDAMFGADNLPFLATSFADARKLAAAQRPFIERRVVAQGMQMLFWVPWPPQGFYAPKPLPTVKDLKGLKFRSYGASAGRLGELAGMQVTTVQAAEAAQAFSTGRVNAMISSGATGFDIKIWESVKFFYDVQAWLPKNMIFVNARAWGGLDAATQAAVMKAASVAELRGWAESERLSSYYLGEFRKNGMTVETPSAALNDGFKRFGEELSKDWLKRAGADGEALIKAYRAGS